MLNELSVPVRQFRDTVLFTCVMCDYRWPVRDDILSGHEEPLQQELGGLDGYEEQFEEIVCPICGTRQQIV